MEKVRKTFFDPLATSKARIREILEGLPVGSAHPFSPERLLLCRTSNGIDEIDISSYPEDFFFNAVDMGEMAEVLLRRMAGFQSHLSVFSDFQIMQAPASTFKIPIVSDQITILAVSERTPTYYDFCFADASCNTCCWLARTTFPGITHSGDILNHNDLLDYVKINQSSLTEKEICVFISGYQSTHITRFLGTHPALLVADHVEKALYVIPVPLDAATIGDATICCPLVIKRVGEFLVCSILSAATTDREKMCCDKTMESPSFSEAIKRADFTISHPPVTTSDGKLDSASVDIKATHSSEVLGHIAKDSAIFITNSTTLPPFLDSEKSQIIRFGTGVEFKLPNEEFITNSSTVVLPCIFGSQLQGPVLLATGTVPLNAPFVDEISIREYYKQLRNVVVVVDDGMTDNARNLATTFRINALFIVQLSPQSQPTNTDEVLELLNSANINAVTALAGPQSLVLIQISQKYYFYRGIANRKYITKIKFGTEVTSILQSVGMESMLDPRMERIISLGDANSIILPISGQHVQPEDLHKLVENISVEQIQKLEEDISAAVPQLQMLLNQKDLQVLSKTLVAALSAKVSNEVAPLRNAYTKFLTEEFNMEDSESVKKKNLLLGQLRKVTKNMQIALEPVISSLANMISSQTTSKRTHDLKRLVRQTQIQGNVEAVKTMTFDTLAGYLETYAGDMGVMLLNIETTSYGELLGNLKNKTLDASSCCELDSRVLHLTGFDAGIIIEQSQTHHDGPLRSEVGPSHPTLALPYLSQGSGSGSMLAWVCWDEFVNLKSPFTVRWMEKCNDAHIAALRIIMRSTLSQAVASREFDIQPSSPETGYLMSALLMAAMSKLAAMRTTAPCVLEKADDTVTRLMRGLFGNLLTMAGSGVRPMSMVWQLFGLNSQNDVPRTSGEWIWYETVVALYPYTGWPLKQFHENLERLLDKAIIYVITKNEDMAVIKSSRADELVKFCKLRNIQLDHSRTIITTLMRMLTTKDADIAAIAARLRDQIPQKLERQSRGYTRMLHYLEHLAKGGQRRVREDLVISNVYASRSAFFGDLKREVAEVFKANELNKVKGLCQDIMNQHVQLAALWNIEPATLKSQNLKPYKDLLNADFGDRIDEDAKFNNLKLQRQVLGDAETWRVPWQVGKKGEFGDDIEPLDEAFVHEMLTGEKTQSTKSVCLVQNEEKETTAVTETKGENQFSQFEFSVQPSFITAMQQNLSGEDVCRILNVTPSAMRVFIKALNPEFAWQDLGGNFKSTVLGLLKDRSHRAESRPIKKLLGLGSERNNLQIEK